MVEINKTWKDRIVHPFVNFFENFNTDTNGIGELGKDIFVSKSMHGNLSFNYMNNTDLRYFLLSKEAVDAIEYLNHKAYMSVDTDYKWGVIDDPIITKLQDITAVDDYWTSGSIVPSLTPKTNILDWLVTMTYKSNCGEQLQEAIRTSGTNKDNVMIQTLQGRYNKLEVTHDYVAKTTHLKYDEPLKLKEHLNYQEYINNGNTDLFLMIPYKDSDGIACQYIYNPTTKLNRPQFSYIALKITDLDGDGDIKFDHIDKIDYLDGFEVTISTQRLI